MITYFTHLVLFSLLTTAVYSIVDDRRPRWLARTQALGSSLSALSALPQREVQVSGSEQMPMMASVGIEGNRTAYLRRAPSWFNHGPNLWGPVRWSLEPHERKACEDVADEWTAETALQDILVLAKRRRGDLANLLLSAESSDGIDNGLAKGTAYDELITSAQEYLHMMSMADFDTACVLPWQLMRWLVQETNVDDVSLELIVPSLAKIAQLIVRFTVLENAYFRESSVNTGDMVENVISLYIYIVQYLVELREHFSQAAVGKISALGSGVRFTRLPESVDYLLEMIGEEQARLRNRLLPDIRPQEQKHLTESTMTTEEMIMALHEFDNANSRERLDKISTQLERYFQALLGAFAPMDTQIFGPVVKLLLTFGKCQVSSSTSMRSEDFLRAVNIILPSTATHATETSILKSCRGLVIHDDENDRFILAHPAIPYWLRKLPEYSQTSCHAYAAQVCLANIIAMDGSSIGQGFVRDIYDASVNGPLRPSQDFLLDNFSAYASEHWLEHCQKAGQGERSAGPLQKMISFFMFVNTTDGTSLDHWFRWYSRQPSHKKGTVLVPYQLSGLVETLDSITARGFLFACATNFSEIVRSTVNHPDVDETVLESALEVLKQNKPNFAVLDALFQPAGRFEVTDKLWRQLIPMTLHQYPDEDALQFVEYLFRLHPGGIVPVAASFSRFSGAVHDLPQAFDRLLERASDDELSPDLLIRLRHSLNHRPKMLEAFVKRIPNFVVTEGMLLAYGHDDLSFDSLQILLAYRGANAVTTDVIRSFFSGSRFMLYQRGVVELLLNFTTDDMITEDLVITSLQSGQFSLFHLLASRIGAEIIRSEMVIVAALSSNPVVAEVRSLLVESPQIIQVTDNMIEALARSSIFEGSRDFELLRILLARIPTITENLLSSIAEHAPQDVLSVVLDYGVTITERVVESALQNFQGPAVIARLQQHAPELDILNSPWRMMEICISNARWQFRVDTIKWLLQEAPGSRIPSSIVESVVNRSDLQPVEQLRAVTVFLDSPKDFTVTEELLNRVLRHAETVDMILALYERSNRLIVPERLLVAAAANPLFGDELLMLFMGKLVKPIATEELFIAAAGNRLFGGRILDYLKGIHGSIISTAAVQEASASRGNLHVMKTLLDAAPDTEPSTSLLLAALENGSHSQEIMALLLTRSSGVILDEALIHRAILNDVRGIDGFELLVERTPLKHISEVTLLAAIATKDTMVSMISCASLLGKNVSADITEDVLEAAISGSEDTQGWSRMTPFLRDHQARRNHTTLRRSWIMTPRPQLAALRLKARRSLFDEFAAAGLQIEVVEEVVGQLAAEGCVDALVYLQEKEGKLWKGGSLNAWIEMATSNRTASAAT